MSSGILLIDKPKGPTSHDVVLAIRRRLPAGTKVGHSGTLDPLASGLLVLLIGPATKSASFYQGLPKSYSGRIRLGVATETGDLDGRVVRNTPVPSLDRGAVEAAMKSHVGTLSLPPPAFSAVKFKGRPLYAYARKGIAVSAPPRMSHVYAWELVDWSSPEIAFRLSCSHGTYARSLAVLLGESLGCAAVLSELRRESVGDFFVEQALPLDAACALAPEALSRRLLPARLTPVPA